MFLTRTRDTQLSVRKPEDLELRAQFAAAQHADLFVSIHFDAGPTPRAHGSMVLCYNPAGQRSTDTWGALKNDAQGAQPGNRFDPWNFLLAHRLYRNLPPALGIVDLGERIQNVSVLRNATVPAVLAEPGYITNDGEAQRLLRPDFRQ